MRTFLILFFLFHSVNLYSLEESLSPSKNFEDSKYIPTFETFTKGYDKTGLYVLLIGGGLASLVQPDDLQIQTDIKNGNSISNGVLKYGDFLDQPSQDLQLLLLNISMTINMEKLT